MWLPPCPQTQPQSSLSLPLSPLCPLPPFLMGIDREKPRQCLPSTGFVLGGRKELGVSSPLGKLFCHSGSVALL
jgi:hypothetical protein